MGVKTNRQLAEMIVRLCSISSVSLHSEHMGILEDAAREVLAAVDEPETQLHAYRRLTVDQGDHSLERELHAAMAAKDKPDGEAVAVAPDGKAGILDAMCEQIEGFKRVLGNMGVALGLVEGQRDDLLGLLRKMTIWADRLGSIAVNCGAIDRAVVLDVDLLAADEVIDRCKAGETKPTVKATSETVDNCTIKLFFTEPEDLEAFVASYQPEVK